MDNLFKLQKPSKDFILKIVAFGVFANGILTVLNSLALHIGIHRPLMDVDFRINTAIVVGITLIYLSTLLSRRKHTAWVISLCIYAFLLVVNTIEALFSASRHDFVAVSLVRTILLPMVVVTALVYYAKEFNVRSDIRSFTVSLRYVILVLAITLVYGVAGFQLLDKRDFHREISVPQAAYYSIDQFGLINHHPLVPHSRRSKVFLDSLSLVGAMSLIYAGAALFQPIRARLTDQSRDRERLKALLEKGPASSEDFFKLWPHDKIYMLTPDGSAGLAYHVTRGVALCVGDPVGSTSGRRSLMLQFKEECRTNDWLPAFIHTEPNFSDFYRHYGYTVQKIGEEAIVNIDHFLNIQAKEKYFRQISNRFVKQGYTTELLKPPQSDAVLSRLRQVSNEWLSLPSRAERGLMMGYFTNEYLREHSILVLRDEASTIQAFINQVPSYDPPEGTYDILRYSNQAPGNTNDYLLLELMKLLKEDGYERFNLGLCPLAGMNKDTEGEDPSVLDNILGFVYTNGNRIYPFSFNGLHRFKAKFEPEWSSRYIAYQGGLRGLTRTTRALTRAMKR